MIPELRAKFNREYSAEKYHAFLAGLDAASGTHVKFRISETPCFFEQELLERLVQVGRELIEQLVTDPRHLAGSNGVIPAEFNVPNEPARPLFVCADFGLVEGVDGRHEPRLVEIQAFPSLYAFQPTMAYECVKAYGLDGRLRSLLPGQTPDSYRALLRRAIVGEHDAENVVLLEIHPHKQKTLPDFLCTEKMLGVHPVCITEVVKDGRRLFYERDGRRVPIERIYNRVIVDELVRLNIRPGFDFRDELEVEWAGHPNWFYRISKFSIPFLNHDSVPRTAFLDRVTDLPDDLDNYVLKPLFSFAGLGVIVGPSREQVEAIPPHQRHQYILQERVNFAATIETPHGATKAEIRVMYIWLDELEAVTTIIRMGRGKMMGVDHNRDMEWVGAAAGLYLPQ